MMDRFVEYFAAIVILQFWKVKYFIFVFHLSLKISVYS